jgi:ABC-type uncharacterized transport system substrate-binding protein
MRQVTRSTLFLLCLILSKLLLASEIKPPPRILFIDSYHEGYTWSDRVTRGVVATLQQQPVALKIHRMDTKRNRDEAFKIEAAEKAKSVIDEFQPDVVIACDDNAAKYLIAPTYINSDLPIVFCGINWDASIYGFPARNITGMIEVEMIEPLIRQLRQYAKGDRIGYLGINSLSSEKVSSHYEKMLHITLAKRYLTKDYTEWVEKYLALQNEVDMLIIGNPQGLTGWNESDFIQLALKQTHIPTGTTASWRTRFSLLSYTRIPEEQGEWAAKSALRIVQGTPPIAIPITHNKEGRLILNLGMADAQGITFEPALFRHAELIHPYSGKRILFIDSYHKDYYWSNGLLKGIHSALKFSGINLEVVRLNSKLYPNEIDIKAAIAKARSRIADFKPDLIITCDDNAMKYLVKPYYQNATTPVVFCGLNWDASVYGLPYTNTTGMIEVDAIEEVLSQLRQYAQGDRIGIIGVNRATARKNVDFIKNNLNIPIAKSYLVESFGEWKSAYSKLQTEVDMVVAVNHIGVSDWDQKAAEAHARQVIKVPVGAFAPWSMRHALISFIKSPHEQGEWSAKTALRILDGTPAGEIPIEKNHTFELVINRPLLEQQDIVIDKALYSRATFVE